MLRSSVSRRRCPCQRDLQGSVPLTAAPLLYPCALTREWSGAAAARWSEPNLGDLVVSAWSLSRGSPGYHDCRSVGASQLLASSSAATRLLSVCVCVRFSAVPLWCARMGGEVGPGRLTDSGGSVSMFGHKRGAALSLDDVSQGARGQAVASGHQEVRTLRQIVTHGRRWWMPKAGQHSRG